MNYFNYIFVFIQLFACDVMHSQSTAKWVDINKEEARKMLQDMSNAYLATPNFSMQVNQASYIGHSSAVVHDEATGKFFKSNKSYVSQLLGLQTVQNEKLKIVIDSANKVIAINNSDRSFKAIPSIEDLDQSLFFVIDIKKMVSNGLAFYSFRFKENFTYTKIEFVLTSDFFMKEMVMYFSDDLPINPDDEEHSAKAKLKYKVSYSGIRKNIVIKPEMFSENQYLIYHPSQKKYSVNEKYKRYKLQDLRATN
ncbi:MAG: hypothetical protein HY062_01625 [Bacteroidetes bacterium]|nr:hypothetical protein [Bacteroidota bacterium]